MKRAAAIVFASTLLLSSLVMWSAVGTAGPVVAPAGDEEAPHPIAAAASTLDGVADESATGLGRVAADPGPSERKGTGETILVEVLVIAEENGQPVPGATVRWWTREDLPRVPSWSAREYTRLRYVAGMEEVLAERVGRCAVSGDDGIARFTVPIGGVRVFAYSDGRYGSIPIGGNERRPAAGWRIVLRTDRSLRVQVVDALGDAVPDVAVDIMDAADGANGRAPRQITGADGMAEFRHVQDWCTRADGRCVFHASARVPGLAVPGTAFEFGAAPPEPVVVRLPLTGKLRARVLHQGKPRFGYTFSVTASEPAGIESGRQALGEVAGDDGWAHFQGLRWAGACGSLRSAATTSASCRSRLLVRCKPPKRSSSI